MKYILIATHGTMAEGMESTIEMICGKKENVKYMSFYTKDVDYEKLVADFIDSLLENDEAVIFTDIFYGSVSKKFLPYLEKKGIHMITGFNLPLVLELIMCDDEWTKETLDECIKTGFEQMYYVDIKEILNNANNTETDDDFF